MRWFTVGVSAALAGIGVWMIASGESFGWAIAGFFGLCILVAIFEPRLPKPWLDSGYRVVITGDGIACEHWKRKRESIQWEDVDRIWYVTTSEGPRLPDEWILLEGAGGGCSFPTEAAGMDAVWDELKQRFAGFEYGPLIRGGVTGAKHLCWERRRAEGAASGSGKPRR